MFSASSETRDRNAPTNANQIRLQTSRRQEHRPIRYQLPARLSFRQGQVTVDERFDGDHGFTLAPFTAQASRPSAESPPPFCNAQRQPSLSCILLHGELLLLRNFR